MKNLLPTLLVVLCSYSSLYFPVISLDARGHLALLRFFQDVLVLHNHAIMFPSILNVFLLNDGIRRNIPKLGYPTLLDIWIFGCFLATFLIRFLYSFIIVVSSPFSHTPPSIQLPVRAGVQLLGHRQGVHREGDREKVLHHLRRALRHLHRRLHRPRSCECLYLSQTN